MLKKLPRYENRVYDPVPVLDEEFSSDDFHPAVFELAALQQLVD